MAMSDTETIEIKSREVLDGRKKLKVYELHIDNCRRAVVEQQLQGGIKFRFDPVGAFDYQEAKVWLQGLLELSMVAEQLKTEEIKRGKKKTKR